MPGLFAGGSFTTPPSGEITSSAEPEGPEDESSSASGDAGWYGTRKGQAQRKGRCETQDKARSIRSS